MSWYCSQLSPMKIQKLLSLDLGVGGGGARDTKNSLLETFLFNATWWVLSPIF